MFQSCKFIPLAFTFSITHLGTRYFQQTPSTQSQSYLRGARGVRGERPGHGGGVASGWGAPSAPSTNTPRPGAPISFWR